MSQRSKRLSSGHCTLIIRPMHPRRGAGAAQRGHAGAAAARAVVMVTISYCGPRGVANHLQPFDRSHQPSQHAAEPGEAWGAVPGSAEKGGPQGSAAAGSPEGLLPSLAAAGA